MGNFVLLGGKKTNPNKANISDKAQVIRQKGKGIKNSYDLMLIRLMLLCPFEKTKPISKRANQRKILVERMLWQ